MVSLLFNQIRANESSNAICSASALRQPSITEPHSHLLFHSTLERLDPCISRHILLPTLTHGGGDSSYTARTSKSSRPAVRRVFLYRTALIGTIDSSEIED
ncbi:hypothetical protein FRC18_008781 [Serendipita sp. 400]|nr:hypothetical protein FRC18_008781 [Serendipita sp. 400]